MRNQTELMQTILTSDKAQEIIDYVTPIYGNSYVGLWIFQSIGYVLGWTYEKAAAMKAETNPATADLLLDYWEDEYGLARDPSLTKDQRRLRLISKTTAGGPCNKVALENAISSALGGVPVEITERTAKNTFLVNIREVVPSINPAVAVIERMKPAHLIYTIQIATQTVSTADIKLAIAMTRQEKYRVEVLQ